MTLVQELAGWISGFDPDSVPAPALDTAKLLVLDSFGCALGALEEDTPRSTLAAVRELGGNPECTVIGTPLRTSAARASLVNGILVRALDARIKQAIRDSATARHVPARVIQVPDIPRSMNGKPSEVAVRDAIQGRAPTNLAGLVNPGALEFFRALPGVNA